MCSVAELEVCPSFLDWLLKLSGLPTLALGFQNSVFIFIFWVIQVDGYFSLIKDEREGQF